MSSLTYTEYQNEKAIPERTQPPYGLLYHPILRIIIIIYSFCLIRSQRLLCKFTSRSGTPFLFYASWYSFRRTIETNCENIFSTASIIFRQNLPIVLEQYIHKILKTFRISYCCSEQQWFIFCLRHNHSIISY